MSDARRRPLGATAPLLGRLLTGVLVAVSLGCSSTVSDPGNSIGDSPGADVATAGAPPSPAAPGAPAPGSSFYPLPADGIYVSPSGSDGSSGTLRHPLRTVEAAVQAAEDGQTLVLRAGSYHESVVIPEGRRLTIQSYPGEVVWLDGSRGVDGFVPDGAGFSAPWDVQFDHSPTYSWGAPDNTEPGWRFLADDRPLAAHPDQVWLDGQPLRQVSDPSELDADSFRVDYETGQLTLGTDPLGRSVRASALAKALSIRSEGTVIRGIGIRRYAPSVPHMGAITAERPGVVLEAMTVRENATTGVSLSAAGIQVRNVIVADNGMLGITATYADALRLDGLQVSGNNREGFRYSPVAGGIKIARSRDVSVSGSIISDNQGTGLWLDESVQQAAVLRNAIRHNAAHGFSAELSADVELIDNQITNNAASGAKINNTSRVRIWNNTITHNGRELNIVQDERRGSNPDLPGHDPRHGPDRLLLPWIVGPVSVHNNILSGAGADCLLCVEDFSREFSAEELAVTVEANTYEPPPEGNETPVVVWAGPGGISRPFATVAEFAQDTGQEPGLVPAPDTPASAAPTTESQSLAPTPRAPAAGLPLPADLAELIGQPAGVRHFGAFTSATDFEER